MGSTEADSCSMAFSRAVLLLMRKQWLRNKRSPFHYVCEIICPVILVVLLVWLYTVFEWESFPAKQVRFSPVSKC